MLAVAAAVLALARHAEGLRLHAYWDGSSYAIGYGHHGHIGRHQTCTEGQAERWLERDLAAKAREVDRLTAGYYVTPGQRAALVDFAFNEGVGSLAHSTLLRRFKRHDVVGAASEFGRWTKAHGRVHRGLVERRSLERRWFLGGHDWARLTWRHRR